MEDEELHTHMNEVVTPKRRRVTPPADPLGRAINPNSVVQDQTIRDDDSFYED